MDNIELNSDLYFRNKISIDLYGTLGDKLCAEINGELTWELLEGIEIELMELNTELEQEL